ncbi:hypothetical protein [Daejeonella lutea]|uniref:TspO and MBR related proteins n=1 Tax=Daejeonella lutea TaxID=572036 RepID=A0A1T5AGA3_9SPHI|nr:hypothetical protein [Daejeonella lutea]SKB33930.1 hypothetical protein SAMN05661099_0688 [Daejeonella lutea]
MTTKSLAILNTVSLTIMLSLSYLAQNKQLSSLDVGQVSAKYETLFAPAGLTFAIWGLIYLALIAFCIYHMVKAFNSNQQEQADFDIRAIGILFIINTLATGAWLVAWVNEAIGLSLLLIIIQLVTLTMISVRAHISNPERELSSKVFTQFPLSIYFGWICIATIANVSAFLVAINWSGFGISSINWVIIMIGVATLLSFFIIFVRRNFFFGLVILWALYGIALKRQQVDEIQYQNVINAAWGAFIVIVIALLIRLFRPGKFKTQPLSKSA